GVIAGWGGRRARARGGLGQERAVPRLAPELPDAARGVVQVAEHARLGGTGLGARRHHLAVADRSPLLLGRDAVLVDALHAVGALLHDAAAPHRDVGVALRLEALRLPVGVLEEVEAAHLVGAVVRAVARADAAVVDHVVQALGPVHRRLDGAHHLAGRVLA